ncbi:trypsin-like peptidase domain-containing protein [Streptomyces sp. NPDC013178]|uniref:trypsin-like peptidase domain-containing protein n=1 Tax=Streptomyces sp. NPDC013178 TaxID=3155118 RepID=UPI0033C84D27
MNEGKPTKAKWWSRPRPQSPGGQESGRENTEGDFELARPVGAAVEENAAAGPVVAAEGGRDDGDYELSRPVSEGSPEAEAKVPAETEPEPTVGASASAGSAHLAAADEVSQPAAAGEPVSEQGAVEVARSGAAHDVVDPVAGVDPVSRQGHVEATRPVPATEHVEPAAADAPSFAPDASESVESVPTGEAPEPAAESVPVGEAPEPVRLLPSTEERPKPLHDPDPYSTPPYGEPGPWAPAPPVQHPAAAAAAQGAAPPMPALPTPVPGSPVPGSPVPGTSAPAVPVPGMPVPGEFTPAAPIPGTPAAGALTPAAPVPAPGATASAPAVPVPGTPAPGTATPAPPAPTPTAPDPASAAAVSPPGVGIPSGPSGPGGAPAPIASVPGAPAAPTDPWHRYDPWAAPAGPLQQTGAAVLTEGQRRRRVRKKLVGGAMALALVSGVFGGVVGVYLERNGGLDGVELPQASAEPAGRPADSVAGIAARALPSVVTLHVSGAEESGTGTGFVLDSLGHILTNNHVVEPAGSDGEITIVFNGGQTAKAEVVGGDSGYDLAVVKVTGVKGLKPLYLGNSDNVRVGDPVVAIGAPFDLEDTVTSGIISAKERPITAGGESGDGSDMSYVDALQTDAPINPGNSGGPLLDAQGHVIGINSAIRSAADGTDSDSGQAGSIGLGFAIPINQGKRVAEELINTGKATHPVIGVTLDMDYSGDGARVGTKGSDGGSPVTPGGPGDRAGIQAGDVITEVDGRPVHSGEELIVRTRAHRPGDRLELTIQRDGKKRTLSLVLGSSD